MQAQKKEGTVTGMPLFTTDKRVVVQIDKISSADKPQLQVAPITVIKTELKLQFLRQIAVNSQYICYGLRQGHIRVLNKASALRALLKAEGLGGDPASPSNLVADMAFFAPGSNILASIDTSGLLTVRRVYEEGEEEGQPAEPAILQEVLCRHQLGVISSVPCSRRLAWHPRQDSLLAVTKGDRVCLVNIPPSSGVAGVNDTIHAMTCHDRA
jgi:enhancer of mRNA-decapping protein 4